MNDATDIIARPQVDAETERSCDPITLEIVRGALRATQSEMEALIEQPQSEKDVIARGRLLLFEARGAAAVRFRR